MKKKDFFAIAYVSLLVIVWGTIGSLIDFPLLQAKVYAAGTIGQIITFTITGVVFSFIGVKLYPSLIGEKFK
tara:strand:+ start:340 stop:555 length:216 start_codon:yes stop_codon:yes gene_type:complete